MNRISGFLVLHTPRRAHLIVDANGSWCKKPAPCRACTPREPGAENSETIYCAFNAHHLPAKVVLPDPPDGCAWRMVADSALQPPYDFLDADDIPAQSKAAAEAMIRPSLASNVYTVIKILISPIYTAYLKSISRATDAIVPVALI